MMRHVCAGVVGCAVLIASCRTAEAAPAATQPATLPAPPAVVRPPVFAGTALPEPPKQSAAWDAPQTKLPAPLVKAAEALFAQGMADPRGCEYRHVEVAVGDVWSEAGQVVATHAWVLPEATGEQRRFAVGWNGLVYPAVSVGERADLAADVGAIVDADKKALAELAKVRRDPAFPFRRQWGVTPEATAVSHASMTPVKVCLLLRAGEAALAEAYWAQFSTGLTDRGEDVYVMLAWSWAWYGYDRAVCAHMRGDDGLALATARGMAAAGPKLKATATAGSMRGTEFVEFLKDLPKLIAEGELRAARKDKPLALADAVKIADRAARIAALIRCLEDVAERQDGQPGGVGLDQSPIVRALEKEGDEAVEPLIACLETDERLTRSVSFGRDFHSGRNFMTVSQAAYVTLTNILQTRAFGAASDLFARGGEGKRSELAKEIRAYWAKGRGRAPAERWYETLADDAAKPGQWIEAAGRIVQPIDVEVRGGWVSDPTRRPGERPAIRGEALRDKAGPSVSELIAKRVPQIAGAEKNSSNEIFNAGHATRVALQLARWDPAAARPVMRAQIDDCKAKMARWKDLGGAESLVKRIAELTEALAAGGDGAALKEYAAWARTIRAKDMEDGPRDLFGPIMKHPADPDAMAAADWLFNDPTSPWLNLATVRDPFGRAGEMLASPLIAVPGFRRAALDHLKDAARVGVAAAADGQCNLKMDGGSGIGFGLLDSTDPLLPKAGEERVVRACDWYAWKLSGLDGCLPFEVYWPADKRDAAIKEVAAFVEAWGGRFAYDEMQQVFYQPPFERARLTFARLDKPATAAQAAAHEAIFTLAPAAEVRAVPLEPYPMPARWKTLERFVVRQQTYDPATKESKVVKSFDQDGLVWQAEEVMEGGRWRRYYGFVGRHVVARVPAEEIEVLKDVSPWGR